MLRRRRPAVEEADLELIDLEPEVPRPPDPAPEADGPDDALTAAGAERHAAFGQPLAWTRRVARVASRPRMLWGMVLVVALIGVAAGVRARVSAEEMADRAEAQRIAEESVDEALQEALDEMERAPARSAEIYDAILPSLIVIQRAGDADSATGNSLGTGVVVEDDGSILTSLHVVDGIERLDLTFSDGTKTTGRVESADRDNDIAVVKPDQLPEIVVPAVLGGGVDVGDEVLTVGHPLGLVASLSAGVVSGLDRSAPVEEGRTLERLIQFDAAVNPGNSGGPLLDREGRVVGIVAALANPTDQKYFIGIGFAVPIATAGGAAGAPPR